MASVEVSLFNIENLLTALVFVGVCKVCAFQVVVVVITTQLYVSNIVVLTAALVAGSVIVVVFNLGMSVSDKLVLHILF